MRRACNRRQLLAAGGSTLAAIVAGCQGSEEAPATQTGDTGTDGTATTTSPTESTESEPQLEPVTVDESWPMYLEGPQNTGSTGNVAPAGPFEERWRYEFEGDLIYRQPIIADGNVYLTTIDGRLIALDAGSGEVIWDIETATDSSVAYADGTLYKAEYDAFRAYDAATGAEQWTYSGDGNQIAVQEEFVTAAPTVVDGTVYAAFGGWLVAMNATTGKRQWRYRASETSGFDGAPAVADRTVFAGLDGPRDEQRRIVAVDVDSGELQWDASPGGVFRREIIAVDGAVYAPSTDGSLYALDAASGEQQWAFEAGDRFQDPAAYRDGTVYASTVYETYAIDAENGEQQWITETDDQIGAVTDDVVLTRSMRTLTGYDPASGDQLWTAEPGEFVFTNPIVASGLLFVIDRNGLQAYQAAETSETQ